MKGPGMRLDLDVRRVWQCPACGREMRSDGQVISKLCGCTREGVAMRLVEVPRPKPTIYIPTPDPDIPELADFPTDLVNPAFSQSPPAEPSATDGLPSEHGSEDSSEHGEEHSEHPLDNDDETDPHS